ncbi:hypothetical protein K439DRAFT_1615415 [Ramaria rubella]|nr:hypothetical protein K439DRAFT_1615415 [Ramaria rubella]
MEVEVALGFEFEELDEEREKYEEWRTQVIRRQVNINALALLSKESLANGNLVYKSPVSVGEFPSSEVEETHTRQARIQTDVLRRVGEAHDAIGSRGEGGREGLRESRRVFPSVKGIEKAELGMSEGTREWDCQRLLFGIECTREVDSRREIAGQCVDVGEEGLAGEML